MMKDRKSWTYVSNNWSSRIKQKLNQTKNVSLALTASTANPRSLNPRVTLIFSFPVGLIDLLLHNDI
jgi:hypothetical protein